MKITLWYCLLLLLSFAGCKQRANNHQETKKDTVSVVVTPKVYLKFVQYNYEGKKLKSKDSVVSQFDKDYLELKLSLYLAGTYKAEFDFLTAISNEKGEDIWFDGSTQFLNFMSDKGYEMIDQSKNKYSTNYTFRKKR